MSSPVFTTPQSIQVLVQPHAYTPNSQPTSLPIRYLAPTTLAATFLATYLNPYMQSPPNSRGKHDSSPLAPALSHHVAQCDIVHFLSPFPTLTTQDGSGSRYLGMCISMTQIARGRYWANKPKQDSMCNGSRGPPLTPWSRMTGPAWRCYIRLAMHGLLTNPSRYLSPTEASVY